MSKTVCCDRDKSVWEVRPVLVAKEVGDFSLAGAQMKFSVVEKAELYCTACGWTITGRVEEGYFVPDKESL